jgi:feruloyl-CoA synthase
MILQPVEAIEAYPERVTDALEHWASIEPERVFVARRSDAGEWNRVSYADALKMVRAISAGLAALNLSAERPLLILSGNSIEHLLLSLAAMYVGVPYCPVSPAYSSARSDLAKLRYVFELLTPGLVATFGDSDHGRVVDSIVDAATPIIGDESLPTKREILSLTDVQSRDPADAEIHHARVGGDTIAKFLLTSGSTGKPKPVITTHRMLCSNQTMIRQAIPFVREEPPVLVDWLPWNHTFGGSHNVGIVLFNGGTLYIDDGKPVPKLIDETLRNLREISPTVYFNVPKGFEYIAGRLQNDDTLRHSFYRRLRACFFAGASLAQHTWDLLDDAATKECGSRVPVLSGLGCTEASPSITFTTPDVGRAGVIGLPAAGNEVKLTPVSGKLELRVRGPNVTPGYWRMPEQTAAAFDDEGYYRLGDAVRLIDPDDASKGMAFDGRISEDFKLASGTWVSTGPLRTSLLAALAPVAQDLIIAGLDEDYIAILIVPDLPACRELVGMNSDVPAATVLANAQLRDYVAAALAAYAEENRAGSTHARRAVLLEEPLSIDKGEITDKGSVNQAAVLAVRKNLVARLYEAAPPAEVIVAVD